MGLYSAKALCLDNMSAAAAAANSETAEETASEGVSSF